MPATAWLPLALFMAVLLSVSLYALAASGHFPREHRGPALANRLGAAILFGSMLICAACLVCAVYAAWTSIPWYAAIIGGGLVMLSAPLLLQPFPDDFVNGRRSLLLFTAAAAALTVALMRVA